MKLYKITMFVAAVAAMLMLAACGTTKKSRRRKSRSRDHGKRLRKKSHIERPDGESRNGKNQGPGAVWRQGRESWRKP
jgi:uncharacterized lipoprotein